MSYVALVSQCWHQQFLVAFCGALVGPPPNIPPPSVPEPPTTSSPSKKPPLPNCTPPHAIISAQRSPWHHHDVITMSSMCHHNVTMMSSLCHHNVTMVPSWHHQGRHRVVCRRWHLHFGPSGDRGGGAGGTRSRHHTHLCDEGTQTKSQWKESRYEVLYPSIIVNPTCMVSDMYMYAI